MVCNGTDTYKSAVHKNCDPYKRNYRVIALPVLSPDYMKFVQG